MVWDFAQRWQRAPELYRDHGKQPYSTTQWNEINYILNNKQGYVIDVQVAIWGVLGTISESDMVSAGYTTAATIYNAAVTNGQNFTPAPGQHTAVMLLSSHRSGSAVWQHLIVEMVNCGSIGEVFWNDSTNNNGILPFRLRRPAARVPTPSRRPACRPE